MIIFYAPMAAFFLGISGIPVPYDLIFMSVLLFILVPVGAGAVSRRFLIPRRGLEWFDNVFRKRIGEMQLHRSPSHPDCALQPPG